MGVLRSIRREFGFEHLFLNQFFKKSLKWANGEKSKLSKKLNYGTTSLDATKLL
jgi:hypothetical protein